MRCVPALGALLALVAALAIPGFAVAAPPRVHQVAVEGFNLSVWEKTRPQPRGAILLIHGRTWSALPNFDLQLPSAGPGSSRSVMDALATAGYATYAVDLRGYGATPRDDSGWLSPPRATSDVVAVLEWIAARHPRLANRPALLGYSRGAHIALMTAQEHPQVLSSLVLFALPGTSGFAPQPAPEPPPRKPTTREAAAEDFITPGAAAPAVIEAYVSQAVTANPVRVDWREEHLFAFDAAAVKSPTLILYGVNDPLLKDGRVLAFFGALATPDRAFVVLPASDHAAHVEDSHRAFIDAVTAFLEQSR